MSDLRLVQLHYQLQENQVPEMYILVAGYRAFEDRELVWLELDACHESYGDGIVVHGDCKHPDGKGYSVDQLAKEWAILNEWPYLSWPARWKSLASRGAGPWRNSLMVTWVANRKANSHALAFVHPQSRGTLDFAHKVLFSNIELKLINPAGKSRLLRKDISDEEMLAFAREQ
jgi:hypothetical protein